MYVKQTTQLFLQHILCAFIVFTYKYSRFARLSNAPLDRNWIWLEDKSLENEKISAYVVDIITLSKKLKDISVMNQCYDKNLTFFFRWTYILDTFPRVTHYPLFFFLCNWLCIWKSTPRKKLTANVFNAFYDYFE